MQPAEYTACKKILNLILSSKYSEKSKFFLVPVVSVLDPVEVPIYLNEIKNPRDLGTIREQLEGLQHYQSAASFIEDVNLCFDNAIAYNASRYTHIADIATSLKRTFKNETEKHNISAINGGGPKPVSAAAVAIVAPPKQIAGKKRLREEFEPKCVELLDSLIKLDSTNLFLHPVDVEYLKDYAIRIDNPVNFTMIKTQLVNKTLESSDMFATLVRRVFANCLRYNYRIRGSTVEALNTKAIRSHAKAILFKFEDDWKQFYPQGKKCFVHLKECLQVIEELLKVFISIRIYIFIPNRCITQILLIVSL